MYLSREKAMIKVGLFDSSFSSQRSMGVDNPLAKVGDDYLPNNFQWVRDQYRAINFYTDMRLSDVLGAKHGTTNVALLIEPPFNSVTHYHTAINLAEKFNYILTYDQNLLRSAREWFGEDVFLFYPFGLSYIRKSDWKIYDKTKNFSMIYSNKNIMPGHKLRHEIAADNKLNKIDLFGTGSTQPILYKLSALKEYRFSVVIENCKYKTWFTEKLIDCFATGTIPMYYGAPDIQQYFNIDGITQFNDANQLANQIETLTRGAYTATDFYNSRRDAIIDNFVRAMLYTIPEDWIFSHYPFIFREHK